MTTPIEVRHNPGAIAEHFGIGWYREAYNQGLTVSQLLEREAPTPEAERRAGGLDAFERVLKAADLAVASIPETGARASTWEHATQTPERRALLPELLARVWRQTTAPSLYGPTAHTRALLLSGDAAVNTLANPYDDSDEPRAKRLAPPIPIESIVATTTPIEGDAYRSLYITDDLNTDAYRMKRIAEGAEIPRTTLVTGERTLRIHKFGRALQTTYEQLRRQRLDRIAFIVRRMAIQAEADKVVDALNTIVNGDGNANTAATVLNQTALHTGSPAGTLTLQAWLTFRLRFTSAYMPTTVLAQEAAMMQLMLLNVGQTNTIPYFMLGGGGALGGLEPINEQLRDGTRYGVTADAPALKLVVFDNSLAIERVTEIGGNVSEVERFITNQTQLLTLTEVEGYGVVDANSSRILNINA